MKSTERTIKEETCIVDWYSRKVRQRRQSKHMGRPKPFKRVVERERGAVSQVSVEPRGVRQRAKDSDNPYRQISHVNQYESTDSQAQVNRRSPSPLPDSFLFVLRENLLNCVACADGSPNLARDRCAVPPALCIKAQPPMLDPGVMHPPEKYRRQAERASENARDPEAKRLLCGAAQRAQEHGFVLCWKGTPAFAKRQRELGDRFVVQPVFARKRATYVGLVPVVEQEKASSEVPSPFSPWG
jgi:hypothetical protein